MDIKVGEMISGVGRLADPSLQVFEQSNPVGSGESFLSSLERSLNEVNLLLNESDQKSTDLALGKTENLHEAMIAGEKAETAFKLMVQFRTKAIEAYNEIMRMQV